MPRAIPLDTDAPVRSLLDAAGLTQVQLAAAAERSQSTIAGAVARGAGIGLDVLARLADAAGLDLVVSVRARE